jgi:hypothetical protein
MVITTSLFIISFGLELEGYFRARPRLLYNISLVKLQSVDPLITYFDSRGLLNVKLGDENIKLISRLYQRILQLSSCCLFPVVL